MDYIKITDIPKNLGIKKGDKIFVSSAVKELLKICRENGETPDLNELIDAFIDAIGEEGTLIFPTYNWSFCGGVTFDYNNTPSQVGALSQTALDRKDFKRTKHPIYSFAVWGADQELLCNMENKSAFGSDSPFVYFKEQNVKNIIINVKFATSFTFVHFVEEQLQEHISHRYMKNFRADYIDADGKCLSKVYQMLVRSYWYDVVEQVDLYEEEFLEKGAQKNIYINGLKFAVIDFAKTYPIIENDIQMNKCRKLCTYKGQNEELPIADMLYGLVSELFPICRSITGDGFRTSIQMIKSYVPQINIVEVKSGTEVFDWTVPAEWNISEAYIEDEKGERIVDFKNNNLHVVGYSQPINQWMSLEELMEHLYVQENQPDAIPYVTSYYSERWGFCMTKNQRDALHEGNYHVVIKSYLDKAGSLTYGEAYYPGTSKKEILISTYLCHPSMANNECSGPAVTAFLARYISKKKNRRYSYRFLFVPETIGSITWLSQNYEKLNLKEKVVAGFVLNCCGDDRTYSFVSTKYGNTLTDRLLRNVLKYHYPQYEEYSFLYRGSDERQYNAPGIDLPVCSVCRSKFGEYPEYHTSKDNLDLVTANGLMGTYELMKLCFEVLENNDYYQVVCKCEPQLGKRGLYPTLSKKGTYDQVKSLTDFLAYADGTLDLIDISNLIHVPISELISISQNLLDKGLIQ